jgi:hypothetical protein
MRLLAFAPLLALTSLGASAATAQYRPGLTVRVTTRAPSQPVVGLLRGSDSSSITVDSAAVPYAAISRVEVYRGIGGRGGTGAMIGAAAGFLVGFAIGTAKGASPDAQWGLIGGIVGAPILGLVGLAVGAAFPVERWDEVPLDQLRGSQRLPGGGLWAGFSFAF